VHRLALGPSRSPQKGWLLGITVEESWLHDRVANVPSSAQKTNRLLDRSSPSNTIAPRSCLTCKMTGTERRDALTAVVTCKFDLDAGQTVEQAFPANVLTDEELSDIAFVALPVCPSTSYSHDDLEVFDFSAIPCSSDACVTVSQAWPGRKTLAL
jgi:hypothetical protein